MKPKGNFIDKLRSRQKTSDDYIFSLKNDDENATQYIEGFSGSGVFIQDGILSYLTGIVLQSKDDYHLINVFDLPKVIKDINNSLEYDGVEKITTNKMDGERTGTNQMFKMIINRNPHNYLVKKVVDSFGSDVKLEELAYDNEKLSLFVEKMKLRKLKKLEQSYQRELADIYLLASFIAKENGNNKKSNNLVVKSMGYKKAFIRYHENPKKYKEKKEKSTSNYFLNFIKYIIFFIILFLIYDLFK